MPEACWGCRGKGVGVGHDYGKPIVTICSLCQGRGVLRSGDRWSTDRTDTSDEGGS